MRQAISALKEWAKDLNRHLTEKDTQTADKPMEKCTTPSVIRKIAMKSRDSTTHLLE